MRKIRDFVGGVFSIFGVLLYLAIVLSISLFFIYALLKIGAFFLMIVFS